MVLPYSKLKEKNNNMDAKIINSFIESTVDVIKIMAFIDVAPGKPYLKKDNAPIGDVSGLIGLTGSKNGSFCISFKKDCILEIISNMFGEEIEGVNEEVEDAVGELTNMITGQVRKKIAELGTTYDAAIPSVISSKGHTIKHLSNGPCISVPFNTRKSAFNIEICFEI